jgi:hypothetical protein
MRLDRMAQEVVHPADRPHDVRFAPRIGGRARQVQRGLIAHQGRAVAPRRVFLIAATLPDVHELPDPLLRRMVWMEVVEELLRALEISDRVRVGEEAGGRRGREDEEWKGLRLESRLEEIVGDDAGVLLRFPEALGEELPHHGVILGPELRRDAVVEDLADLRVVEMILGTRRVDEVVHLLQELERLQERHALDTQAAEDGS